MINYLRRRFLEKRLESVFRKPPRTLSKGKVLLVVFLACVLLWSAVVYFLFL